MRAARPTLFGEGELCFALLFIVLGTCLFKERKERYWNTDTCCRGAFIHCVSRHGLLKAVVPDLFIYYFLMLVIALLCVDCPVVRWSKGIVCGARPVGYVCNLGALIVWSEFLFLFLFILN